jgi:hypothetical protein
VARTDTFGTAGTGVPDGDEEVPGAERDDFFCTLRGAEDGMGGGAGVGSDSVRAGLWGVFPPAVSGSVATGATDPNAPFGLAVKFKGVEVPKRSIERAGDSALSVLGWRMIKVSQNNSNKGQDEAYVSFDTKVDV